MMFPIPNNPAFAHNDTLIDGELTWSQPNPDQPVSCPYFDVSNTAERKAHLYICCV